MKTEDIYIVSPIGKVFECLPKIAELDCDPDPGMRFRLKDISIESPGCYSLIGDFGEFENINKPLARANFFDNKGVPRETWMDQPYYEAEKHSTKIYLEGPDDVFIIVQNAVYEKYLKDNSGHSYLEWLENIARNSF